MERGSPSVLKPVKLQRGSKKGVPKLLKWDERLIEMAFQFALLGATDKELAAAFDVTTDTISVWKRKHPQFREGYSKGKVSADAKVAYSLYQNSIGFDYYEQQIVRMSGGYEFVDEKRTQLPGTYELVEVRKHHIAESWAGAKWLELRRSTDWSATQKFEVKNINTNVKVDFAKLTTEQLSVIKSLYQASNMNKLM